MIRLTSLFCSLAIAVLPSAGCDDDDDDGVFPPIAGDDDIGDGTPFFAWNATLIPFDPFVITGQASVTQAVGGNAFTATASIRNDIEGSVRPWHVHFGTCGSGGGIVGTNEEYPRLVVGSDGAALTLVRIPLTLDPNAAYHVNVHLSNDQLGVLMACGDLVLR